MKIGVKNQNPQHATTNKDYHTFKRRHRPTIQKYMIDINWLNLLRQFGQFQHKRVRLFQIIQVIYVRAWDTIYCAAGVPNAFSRY